MQYKEGLYCFLLLCVSLLLPSGSDYSEDDFVPDMSTVMTYEFAIETHIPFTFLYDCEPGQLPGSIFYNKKFSTDKAEIKSLSKYLKQRIFYAIKPVTDFGVRIYSLQNLYLAHSPTQSQLQIFII